MFAGPSQAVAIQEATYPMSSIFRYFLQTQNNELQQFFAVQGYPTVWFVNASKKDGKTNFDKLGTTGYLAGGPENWLNVANEIIKKK